jgi:hypothetical protein
MLHDLGYRRTSTVGVPFIPPALAAVQSSRLVQPHGDVIVAEYFDVGQSRRCSGRASRSIGCSTFYGNQLGMIFPLFTLSYWPTWLSIVRHCESS